MPSGAYPIDPRIAQSVLGEFHQRAARRVATVFSLRSQPTRAMCDYAGAVVSECCHCNPCECCTTSVPITVPVALVLMVSVSRH